MIVRPQFPTITRQASPSPSAHLSANESSVASSARSSVENRGSRSPSPGEEENFKTEARSPSPATSPSPPSQIKHRRSTEQSLSPPPADLSPIAGRSFYAPIGSYLSTKDTANVHKISDLMALCEELNLSATQNSTALSTVYPVQFILKSHAYDARMHFLAGSPTLASVLLGTAHRCLCVTRITPRLFCLLGQPGDLVAAKTGLKITQRLRLDQHKLDDLERNLRSSVTTAISTTSHQSQSNLNGQLSASSILPIGRKQLAAAHQTKFVVLISSPATLPADRATKESIKNEAETPPHRSTSNDTDTLMEFKREKIDNHDDNSEEEDETSLSRLISYLTTYVSADRFLRRDVCRFLGKKQPVWYPFRFIRHRSMGTITLPNKRSLCYTSFLRVVSLRRYWDWFARRFVSAMVPQLLLREQSGLWRMNTWCWLSFTTTESEELGDSSLDVSLEKKQCLWCTSSSSLIESLQLCIGPS